MYDLTTEQKAANAIELAVNLLVIARDNMEQLTDKEAKEVDQLMTESLMEFINFEYLKEIPEWK